MWVYEEALQEMYYVGKGRFRWLKSKGGGRSKDSLVGKDEPCGYRIIGYTATNKRRYYLKNSYLVWIHEKGVYPKGVIDHINRVKSGMFRTVITLGIVGLEGVQTKGYTFSRR
jgi:hypothetical protein